MVGIVADTVGALSREVRPEAYIPFNSQADRLTSR